MIPQVARFAPCVNAALHLGFWRCFAFTVTLLELPSATLTVMKHLNSIRLASIAIAAASLSACYVMPTQYDSATGQYKPVYPQTNTVVVTQPAAAPAVIAAAPSSQVMMARLYPNNAAASPYGMVPGTVTNYLNGRGEIVVTLGDEIYRGEATRLGTSSNGTANGAGSKGGYMNCSYTMNSTTMGRGTCNFGNGAQFSFHLGN